MLATLFVARGTPMLTAGDEFGRTQGGNNNAYAQDNGTTWLDWAGADHALAAFAGRLVALRKAHRSLSADAFLTGTPATGSPLPDATWLSPDGGEMTAERWNDGQRVVGLVLYVPAGASGPDDRTAVWINGGAEVAFGWLPPARAGRRWTLEVDTSRSDSVSAVAEAGISLPPRSVLVFAEVATEGRPAT